MILLSKNSPETGQRVFNSIKEFGLDISRAAFTSGRNPCSYMPAYNVSLFLSTNRNDVNEAIAQNFPAGVILKSIVHDDEKDTELRVAFDFDGVLADESSRSPKIGARRVAEWGQSSIDRACLAFGRAP